MTPEEKKTLINYCLERANESIRAAELMLQHKMHVPAMNRIYYSMFYAVQALLILKEHAFSKHGQVRGFFKSGGRCAGINRDCMSAPASSSPAL